MEKLVHKLVRGWSNNEKLPILSNDYNVHYNHWIVLAAIKVIQRYIGIIFLIPYICIGPP